MFPVTLKGYIHTETLWLFVKFISENNFDVYNDIKTKKRKIFKLIVIT